MPMGDFKCRTSWHMSICWCTCTCSRTHTPKPRVGWQFALIGSAWPAFPLLREQFSQTPVLWCWRKCQAEDLAPVGQTSQDDYDSLLVGIFSGAGHRKANWNGFWMKKTPYSIWMSIFQVHTAHSLNWTIFGEIEQTSINLKESEWYEICFPTTKKLN